MPLKNIPSRIKYKTIKNKQNRFESKIISLFFIVNFIVYIINKNKGKNEIKPKLKIIFKSMFASHDNLIDSKPRLFQRINFLGI